MKKYSIIYCFIMTVYTIQSNAVAEVILEGDILDNIKIPDDWYDLEDMENSMSRRKDHEDNTKRNPYVEKKLDHVKSCKTDEEVVLIYIRRYTSLFLRSAKLQNVVIPDGDLRRGNIEFVISSDELKFLQSISSDNHETISEQLHKLDKIISKFMDNKRWSIYDMLSFDPTFIQSWLKLIYSYFNIDMIYFLCYILSVIFYLKVRQNIFESILIFLNNIAITDSFKCYLMAKQKAAHQNYIDIKKLEQMVCNNDQSSWFYYLKTRLWSDPCEQSHLIGQISPAHQSSLLECFKNIYLDFLIKTPIHYFGAGISEFNKQISGLFMWPFDIIINASVVIAFIMIILPMLVSLGCGKRSIISTIFGRVQIDARPDQYERIQELPQRAVDHQQGPIPQFHINVNVQHGGSRMETSEFRTSIMDSQTPVIDQPNMLLQEIERLPSQSREKVMPKMLELLKEEISSSKSQTSNVETLNNELASVPSQSTNTLEDERHDEVNLKEDIQKAKLIFNDIKEHDS